MTGPSSPQQIRARIESLEDAEHVLAGATAQLAREQARQGYAHRRGRGNARAQQPDRPHGRDPRAKAHAAIHARAQNERTLLTSLYATAEATGRERLDDWQDVEDHEADTAAALTEYHRWENTRRRAHAKLQRLDLWLVTQLAQDRAGSADPEGPADRAVEASKIALAQLEPGELHLVDTLVAYNVAVENWSELDAGDAVAAAILALNGCRALPLDSLVDARAAEVGTTLASGSSEAVELWPAVTQLDVGDTGPSEALRAAARDTRQVYEQAASAGIELPRTASGVRARLRHLLPPSRSELDRKR